MVVYFDDILIFCSSLAEHEDHLRHVLHVLRREKFFVAKHKCEIGVDKMLFLGYVISATGLSMDESKVVVVHLWPEPRTV